MSEEASPEPGREQQNSLVVIGSSAGGVEALSVLLGSLKADFGAPVVVAQHLDPNRPSHLGTILERRTPMKVVVVGEPTRLERGSIYVVPSNRHVVIRDGHVDLDSDHGDRPRPSVDLLLSSAAQSYGDRLVAVILTGSGSDGAAGAVDVKAAGGTVIIQNPATAAYPSMPLALPPTAVDHVADLHLIGPLLQDLVAGVRFSEQVDPAGQPVLEEILTLVGRRSAIDFRPYKPTTILRRFGRRMAIHHLNTLHEYKERLESDPQEMAELVMALLIKVTEFFRDADAFNYLRQEILPALITRGRAGGRTIRLWSAGCATGEEAYSLALLLADLLGTELPEWTVKVFATDLDEAAIAFARQGLYPANVLRNVPADYQARFFQRADHGLRISRALRQMVIFGHQDLSRGVPFPRIDLVVCRNLLIYFKPELQQQVLELFAYSLHQTAGYLFLGKAETARPSKASFELVNKRWKLYRCTSPRQVLPVNRSPGSALALSPAPQRRIEPRAIEADGHELELAQLRRYNDMLLRFVGVGIMVIDQGYRILSVNNAARRLLGIREARTDQDFLHTARSLPYTEMRAALDRVFRERAVVTLDEVALSESAVTETRVVSLSVAPVYVEGARIECALVTLSDVTELVEGRRRLTEFQDEQRKLVLELEVSNHRAAEINKELQDANEELQAINEEMMLAQEELQATNEEFEATNEELQATNEELETNNEELQATNEELETTNEELNARTGELQELMRVVTTERQRLGEMVDLAPFYIVVLRGPGLLVEAVNPPSARLFGGQDAVGGALDEVAAAPELEVLVHACHQVVRRDSPWSSPPLAVSVLRSTGPPTSGAAPVSERRYLVFTVVPTHDAQAKVDGLVIYADDVTEKMALEAQERRRPLALMVEHAGPVALSLYDATTGQLLHASSRYLEMLEAATGMPRDRVAALRWTDLVIPNSEAGQVFTEVVASGRVRRLPEIRVRLGEQSVETIWDCSLIPIASDSPPPAVRFVVVSAVDVTRQAQVRQALEQQDHLKDEFLSLASHELRTPLVPLTTYADLLDRLLHDQPELDRDQVADIISKFRKQLGYLGRLVDDLLDVARLQTAKLSLETKRLDLRPVLERAAEAFSAEGVPPLRLELPEAPVWVEADESRVLQVLGNLLGNARRHAPKSEHVDLRLRVEDGNPAEKDTKPPRARVEVQDYGPGIPAEARERLFTRFFQVSREGRPSRGGLGLGLSIAKAIVEQHEGAIGIDSIPGDGTRAWFELPIVS